MCTMRWDHRAAQHVPPKRSSMSLTEEHLAYLLGRLNARHGGGWLGFRTAVRRDGAFFKEYKEEETHTHTHTPSFVCCLLFIYSPCPDLYTRPVTIEEGELIRMSDSSPKMADSRGGIDEKRPLRTHKRRQRDADKRTQAHCLLFNFSPDKRV